MSKIDKTGNATRAKPMIKPRDEVKLKKDMDDYHNPSKHLSPKLPGIRKLDVCDPIADHEATMRKDIAVVDAVTYAGLVRKRNARRLKILDGEMPTPDVLHPVDDNGDPIISKKVQVKLPFINYRKPGDMIRKGLNYTALVNGWVLHLSFGDTQVRCRKMGSIKTRNLKYLWTMENRFKKVEW